MRSSEAGPCACTSSGTSSTTQSTIQQQQHRYLWTDAFAVLAYETLAEYYKRQKNEAKTQEYKEAVEKLIGVVHQCLGRPRSDMEEDVMAKCDISPTGYAGLRIGKVCII